ncbi:MAG: zf-TFIIB domain-containing protein [Pyrinomonadaceae bacterium]|nr:zf-TFIIB domain-containing protein [Phycisphaerales bacterium]
MKRMFIGQESRASGGATVDHCDHCGAIWLDAGELAVLVKNPDLVEQADYGGVRAPGPIAAIDGRLCPRDSTELTEVPDTRQKHVRVDKCRTCLGVLLDAGELADLGSYTIKERLQSLVAK